jgi:hypothetical protein
MRPIALCFLAACVAPLDDDTGDPLASTESAIWDGGPNDPNGEVIWVEGQIEGDTSPCWAAGLCWVGVSPEDPTGWGDTGDWGCGRACGGGGGGAPWPPKRRTDCAHLTRAECHSCCYWNFDVVDRFDCESKPTRPARDLCWLAAFIKYTGCAGLCPKNTDPIIARGQQ